MDKKSPNIPKIYNHHLKRRIKSNPEPTVAGFVRT